MKLKHILTLLFSVLVLLAILTGCTDISTVPEDTAPAVTAAQTETEEAPSAAESATDAETAPETQSETQSETAEETTAEVPSEFASLVDFIVPVESGRDVRVLQLTDTQIIDASQQRYDTRLDEASQINWGHDKFDFNYKNYVREVITNTNPDFIFITGDVVYGEFDDTGAVLLDFIEFMESFGIPWAPVFGNHDNESKMGVDWQCEQFEKAEHCLFKQRDLTGNGNYTVGILQGGRLARVFFMMDSNGCGAISSESLANKHSTANVGFKKDQVNWFRETAAAITAQSPDTKLSFAFHIQLSVFTDALSKYGFTNSNTVSNPINIDTAANKEPGDFGYVGRDLKSPWDNGTVWEAVKATGADSIFVGHEHCNSASVVYEGVRLQYGQKSSTYDRFNYAQSDGSIEGGYTLYGTPIVGGTFMTLKEGTGEITEPHIVLATAQELVKPDAPKAEFTYTFDFNGTDINATVTTADVKAEPVAVAADTYPEGATGGVCSASSDYLVAIGVKFNQELDYDTLASMKIRMYVQQDSNPTKATLFRLYDASNNVIRGDYKYSACGGKVGQWCEIEVADVLQSIGLVKNGKVQAFTIVYRCYGAQSTVYFDSVTVQTSAEIK